jgi:hypothetical protein
LAFYKTVFCLYREGWNRTALCLACELRGLLRQLVAQLGHILSLAITRLVVFPTVPRPTSEFFVYVWRSAWFCKKHAHGPLASLGVRCLHLPAHIHFNFRCLFNTHSIQNVCHLPASSPFAATVLFRG